MKIGVFGGTFDPIHNGHIIVAEEARARLDLAEVLFIPAGQPYLKTDIVILPAGHRVKMVCLAIADHPCFTISTMEIERSGPTYTIDTITQLKSQLNKEDEIFFIVGWDILYQLPRWKEPYRLIWSCQLVAVPRPGYSRPDLMSLEPSLPGISKRVIMLDRPEVDISGTEVRERVTKGLPITDMVPKLVEEYIKRFRLYAY